MVAISTTPYKPLHNIQASLCQFCPESSLRTREIWDCRGADAEAFALSLTLLSLSFLPQAFDVFRWDVRSRIATVELGFQHLRHSLAVEPPLPSQHVPHVVSKISQETLCDIR